MIIFWKVLNAARFTSGFKDSGSNTHLDLTEIGENLFALLKQTKIKGGILIESNKHEILIAENEHLLTQLNIARREVMRLQAHEHVKTRQVSNESARQSELHAQIQALIKKSEDQTQQINALEQRLIEASEDKAQQINALEQRLIRVLREQNRLHAPRTWLITKPLIGLIEKLYALRRRLDERRLSRQLADQSLFDAEYYLTQYPDVRQVGIAPVVHYLRYGWWEGRNPNPNFDTQAYLAQNPDVKMAGINPLLHYAQHGKFEGRPIGGKA